MKLEKEFKISEVNFTNISDAPFRIFLESEKFSFEQKNILTMDKEVCARFNIPMSQELVGKKLVCAIESKEALSVLNKQELSFLRLDFMPPQRNWQKKSKNPLLDDPDIVRIKSLKKVESHHFFGSSIIRENNKIARTLELVSLGEGDGMHIHITPCPFYSIFLSLTEEEYKECQQLQTDTLFKIDFRLKV